MKRAVAPGSLLALLFALAAAPPAAASFRFLKPGMEAAEFTLRTLDDRELTLSELKAAGRGTLVVFWATWSPRSQEALAGADALYREHGPRGLRAVAVNVDRAETGPREQALVRGAVEGWNLALPVAFDPGFGAASSFGLVANPSVALLDAGGVLLWETAGWSRSSAAACREQVEALLGIRPPAGSAPAPAYRPPRRALLSYNLGRRLLAQGNRAKAAALIEEAAGADPGWAAPRVLLGHMALGLDGAGHLARAERLFREASGLDPSDAEAASGLGEALLRLGRADEAATQLERALAIDPTYTPAVAARAMLLARQGRTAEALAFFDSALALNPRDAAVLAGRAGCREAAGTLEAAADDYRAAVEILLGAR